LIFAFSSCNKNNKNGPTDGAGDNNNGYSVTLKDSYDREVNLDKEPERIVSVAPHNGDNFCVGQAGQAGGTDGFLRLSGRGEEHRVNRKYRPAECGKDS